MTGVTEDNFFAIDSEVNEFGVQNGLYHFLEKSVKSLANKGLAFSICYAVDDRSKDLMKIEGASGNTLGRRIAGLFPEDSYRTAIYRYLLHNFLCYVEIPTYRNKDGVGIPSYDKYLATSNISIIAAWLEVDEETAEKTYGAKLAGKAEAIGTTETPYLKVEVTKDGNRKVVRPRNWLTLEQTGIRITPLLAYKSYIEEVYKKLTEGYVEFTYLKDGGSERKLVSTLNRDLLESVYGTELGFVDDALAMSYNGDWLETNSVNRGYIRLPEVGLSKYDTGVRAVNFARIVGIRYDNVETDLTFVHIDLENILEDFKESVLSLGGGWTSRNLVEALLEAGFDSSFWYDKDGKALNSRTETDIIRWVNTSSAFLGTGFKQAIYLFMTQHADKLGAPGDVKVGSKAVLNNTDVDFSDISGDLGLL